MSTRTAPKTIASLDREDFLEQELGELTQAIKDSKPGTVAYGQLRRQRASLHKELDEIRSARLDHEAAERARSLAEADPDDRRRRLADRARLLPLDLLEPFVNEYVKRHGGRVELLVHRDRVPGLDG